VDQELYNRLSTDPTITSYVGPRIYPVMPERGADYPFIVYDTSDVKPFENLQGPSGLARYTVGVQIVAINFDTARSIASAVKARLNFWSDYPIIRISKWENDQAEDLQDMYSVTQTFTVVA
jgi:hypothetical protein